MPRCLAILSLATLTAGAGYLAMGCGSSTSAHSKDAAAGGALGTGGLLGPGGTTAVGGRAGSGGLPGSGGAIVPGGAIGTGGARPGGSTGPGVGGRGGAAGSGGAAMDGGTASGGKVGTGGAAVAGSMGAGGATARDANDDGPKDGPGLDGGQSIVYSGCGYVGGIDRAVVAKFDERAGVCVTLVMESPSSRPDAGFGMTISPYWGVSAIALWPSATAACATRFPSSGALGASAASGSVTVDRMSGTIDIDAVFDFPSNDAGPAQSVEMKAQGVDFMKNC